MAIACSTTGFTRLPLEGALQAIHELGFPYVDLVAIEDWVHIMPSDLVSDYGATLDRVRALLERYTLTPLAINAAVRPLLHDRSPEACAERAVQTGTLVRFLNDLSLHILPLMPRELDRTRPLGEVLQDSAASLREILAIAEPAGIVVALECHIHSIAETIETALDLIDLVPGLRITYDPSHLVMQGIDLDLTAPLIDYAAHVHLRDSGRRAMQSPYGQGETDFAHLLDLLQQRGYQGHISIEYIDRGGTDVSQDILALYQTLLDHGLGRSGKIVG